MPDEDEILTDPAQDGGQASDEESTSDNATSTEGENPEANDSPSSDESPPDEDFIPPPDGDGEPPGEENDQTAASLEPVTEDEMAKAREVVAEKREAANEANAELKKAQTTYSRLRARYRAIKPVYESNMQGHHDRIANQVKQRTAHHIAMNELKPGELTKLRKALGSNKAAIDNAMSRKNARGTQRPKGPVNTQGTQQQ